ncbi:MAG: heme o synthase [Tepidisphaeraceae bacterium]
MTSAETICEIPSPAASAAPPRWASFLELVKPRMNLLILGTTFVGYDMAARVPADWRKLAPTLIGTALCAGSAAVLNQLVESKHDALMPRTARRPIPTGRISPSEALALGLTMGIAGGAALWLFVNGLTAMLGILTLASYVLLYTPLKRLTTMNTLVGAVPGAIPPVMGWTAVSGSLWLPAVAIFGILFVWQIPHFLAIAILYREDYRKGGFKMLPVEDSDLPATGRQILLYTAALLPISLLPVAWSEAGRVYAVSAVVLGAIFLYYAARCAISRQRSDARKLFFTSIIYLPALLTILMLDRV